jgi:DNA-directed RNA polymerase specialized sigma24 family protein
VVSVLPRSNDLIEIIDKGNIEGYMCRAIYLHFLHAKQNRRETSQLEPKHESKVGFDEFFENKQSKLHTIILDQNIDLIINRLNDFDAELLRLWMLPDFRYKDAAEITGIPIAQLQNNIHSSIRKLKRYVQRASISQAKTPGDL